MTPSMNMGMKGPQQAGLASIGQPANQPRGKSPESIGEIMALAKKLSDGELADILSGKSMAVPQYVAMTEAMGRRSLRNAVKGAQAMTQANQPSVKDKFMMAEAAEQMPQMAQQQMPQMAQQQMPQMAAGGGLMYEEGGLASLPAYNMDTVDMAGGGIIAFQNTGVVKDPRMYDAEGNYIPLYERTAAANKQSLPIEKFFKRLFDTKQAGIESARSKELDPRERRGDQPGDFPMYTPIPVDYSTVPPAVPPKPDAKPNAVPPGGGGSGGLSDLASFDDLLKKRTTDYLSKYEGLEDKKRARAANVKKDLQSQVLLDASSALLGSRNIAEAGGKFGSKTASTLAAARAEENQLEDAADQYGFNIAKAREAAEKGDMQLAMQYTQLANQNKYQMGMVDVYKQRNAILGDQGNMGKVSTALLQADKQALAEAKQKFPMLTPKNQAAYDAFFKKRARELKIGNPLTKQYADLSGGDLGGGRFNMVQSLPKGASVFDPTEG
jgi:hypothetical protein